MNAAVTPATEQELRGQLSHSITVLERLGIIDFNGHVSARVDDESILINTGSSIRSAITPDDFVCVPLTGNTDAVAPAPPKELPLHLSIYAARPDVRCVVHGHPRWSTLLTSTDTGFEVTIPQGAVLGNVRLYSSPSSINNREAAAAVADTLGDDHAVLLKSHGSVVAGAGVLEASVLAIYLEMNAERHYRALLIGQPYCLTRQEREACRKNLRNIVLFEKCWNYYLAKFGLPVLP